MMRRGGGVLLSFVIGIGDSADDDDAFERERGRESSRYSVKTNE